MLEYRLVLSADSLNLAQLSAAAANHPFPTGLDFQDPTIRSAIADVTTTAATDLIARIEQPQFKLLDNLPGIQPNLIESNDLIGLNAFRQDPRFAGIDGSGFATVILDTGIDLNHPFFGPDADFNGVADRIVFNADFITGRPNADDFQGHGTHVSSIVGSQDPTFTGMAPGVNIIHLKVLDDFGGGTAAALEQALQWVVANTSTYNIASVNMSLGFFSNFSSPTTFPDVGIFDELAALAAQNVIVASAAGNDYFSFQSPGVSYPAADPNSLAVGAVWDANVGGVGWIDGAVDFTTAPDRIISFSQRHPVETTVFAPGAFIAGAAPGGGIAEYAGTSQATPHIAGIAALMQELAVRETGQRLTVSEFSRLVNITGVPIFDGDDENDNVPNTLQTYHRVDVLALGNAIESGGLSDLTIPGELAASSSTASPGGFATVDFTVANQGASDSGNFRTGIYLSTDPIFDATDRLLTSFDSSLVAGGSLLFNDLNVLLPTDVAPGSYYLGLVVDDLSQVAEGGETNNVNLLAFSVVAPSPELRVLDLTTGVEVVNGFTHIDFGLIPFEDPAATRTLRLYNDGPVDLALSYLALPPQFSAALPASVPALSSVDVTISMLSNVAGDQFGLASLGTGDIDENPFQFTVGGIVAFPDDHGDDAATATPIEVPSFTFGEIFPSGDLDWFSFEAFADTSYEFSTYLNSLGDSILYLFDSDGVTQLAFNDDYFSLASYIYWIAPHDGTFYLAVGGYGASAGSYYLSTSLIDDFGNSAFQAAATSDPGSIDGRIQYGGDTDWFYWNAVAGVTYRIETLLDSLTDSVLRVFDSDGVTELAFNDDHGESSASLIEWVAPKDGIFFIEVSAFSEFQRGSYTLSILGDDDFGENAANAAPISTPSLTSGEIEVPFDTDWFLFDAVAGAHYQIATVLGTLSDSVVRIIDGSGFYEVARDDDSGPGLASLIDWVAPYSGAFYIEVAGSNWRFGSYQLSLTVSDDHGNNGTTATRISDPTTESGIIEQFGDVDWFSFTAYAGVSYHFETYLGDLADSVLRVYGTDKQTVLAYDDDAGFGLASLVDWVAPSTGIYFVEVSGFSDSYRGSYNLQIVGDDDYGDNARNAAYTFIPSTIPGRIERANDVDWFAVNMDVGLTYRFEVLLDSLPDSVIRLYAGDGVTELAFDDEGGTNHGSLLEYTPASYGLFYLEVAGYGLSNGSYSLRLSIRDDHGDNSGEATPIAVPTSLVANIDRAADTDWFSFQAVAGNSYRFETSLITLHDSVMSLMNTDGVTPLAFDDDSGPGLASLINWIAPADGTYYVLVASYSSIGTGTYQLNASSVAGLSGDFTHDGYVGDDDYNYWRQSFGSVVATAGSGADGNRNGIVDAGDYAVWRDHLGSSSPGGSHAPWVSTVEPKTLALENAPAWQPPVHLLRAFTTKGAAVAQGSAALVLDATVLDSGYAALGDDRVTLPSLAIPVQPAVPAKRYAKVSQPLRVSESVVDLLLAETYRDVFDAEPEDAISAPTAGGDSIETSGCAAVLVDEAVFAALEF
ncbi:MAG: S8 family serine peptidase [Pirellulales bacterium]